MMYRDQRHPQCQRDGFGKVHADEHRADQSRRIGHRHSIDLLPGNARRLDGALRQKRDGFHMTAGSDLRHNTAIDSMQISLGKDLICQYFSSILYDGHGGLVTGGLKCKDLQWFCLISNILS